MSDATWGGLFEQDFSSRRGQAIDWDVYARAYDLLPEVFGEYRENIARVEEALRKYLPSTDRVRLCDLGAGTGNYISHLASLFPDWSFTHVDSNVGMNRVARKKYANINASQIALVECSAQEVRFPNQSFDAIICINALYAMSPQNTVLRRVRRWLRPNGVFVCIDFGRKQNPLDWLVEFLVGSFTGRVPIRTAGRALAVAGNVFAQAVKGAGGQSSGQYWMHDLDEFSEKITESGMEILEAFTCYRGYCDAIVARTISH